MSVQQRRGYYPPLPMVIVSTSNDHPPSVADDGKSSCGPIRHTRKRARQQTLFQATRTTWGLPDKLTALSVSDTWATAIREWEVERLRKFMYPKECLCDLSSKKICYLRNKHNGATAQIGGCCLIRIKERDSPELSKVLPMFQSLAAIKKDRHLAASVELIDYVVMKGVFKDKEARFYRDTQARS